MMPMPFSDLPAFRRDPLRLLRERAAAHPPGFAPLYFGLKPMWMVTDPALARAVLKWDTAVIDKGSLVQTIVPLVGRSLLTNTGNEHSQAKHAMHRHVHRNGVAQNLERMVGIMNQFVSKLMQQGNIDTDRDLPPLAFQLACIVVFGHDAITTADRTILIDAVRVVEAAVAARMFRIPFLPRMPGDMRRETEKLNNARAAVALVVSRVRANEKRSGVIRGLEEAGFDDEQIIAEILGLLIAGHHTSGATMGWLVHHMASDPELADMMALEADSVLPAIEANDQTALKQATLSNTYVNEILRLYPAGWWTSREVFKPVEIGGKRFAVGDMLMITPWQMHRDPRYWFQPDQFRYDREYTEDAYMPFGIGPRACIGMSIALFELQLFCLQLASAVRFHRESDRQFFPKPSITLLFPGERLKVQVREERHASRMAV